MSRSEFRFAFSNREDLEAAKAHIETIFGEIPDSHVIESKSVEGFGFGAGEYVLMFLVAFAGSFAASELSKALEATRERCTKDLSEQGIPPINSDIRQAPNIIIRDRLQLTCTELAEAFTELDTANATDLLSVTLGKLTPHYRDVVFVDEEPRNGWLFDIDTSPTYCGVRWSSRLREVFEHYANEYLSRDQVDILLYLFLLHEYFHTLQRADSNHYSDFAGGTPFDTLDYDADSFAILAAQRLELTTDSTRDLVAHTFLAGHVFGRLENLAAGLMRGSRLARQATWALQWARLALRTADESQQLPTEVSMSLHDDEEKANLCDERIVGKHQVEDGRAWTATISTIEARRERLTHRPSPENRSALADALFDANLVKAYDAFRPWIYSEVKLHP